MKNSRRSESREQVSLTLQLHGGERGLISDVSASGLYFEIDSAQQVGSLIDFEIELDTPGGPMKLKAQGTVVRIESNGGRIGVGVKLLSSRLEAVE
jgi:hypothetical protein